MFTKTNTILLFYLTFISHGFQDVSSHLCSVSSPIDLILLIDSTWNGHVEYFERIKEFISGVIQDIPENSYVAISQYTSKPITVLTFQNATEKYDGIGTILELNQIGGTDRRTNNALWHAFTSLRQRNNKERPGRILLVSGGRSTDGVHNAKKIKEKGIPLAVIDTGKDTDREQFAMVGLENIVKQIDGFDMLDDIKLKQWTLDFLCPRNNDLIWNRSFKKIRPSCRGTEVCAHEVGGQLIRLCLCHDNFIGRACGTSHPYGDDMHRCHSLTPKIIRAEWEKIAARQNFTGLRPCFGIELCAINDKSGTTIMNICSCEDPVIGDVCSEEHAWFAVGRRCHFKKDKLALK